MVVEREACVSGFVYNLLSLKQRKEISALWVFLLRLQGVLPKLCLEQWLVSITSGSRRKCSVWSHFPGASSLCTRVCVSPHTLVAAEMAEYLSSEWKCL